MFKIIRGFFCWVSLLGLAIAPSGVSSAPVVWASVLKGARVGWDRAHDVAIDYRGDILVTCTRYNQSGGATALLKYRSKKKKPIWSYNIETPNISSEGKFIRSCYPSGIYLGDEITRLDNQSEIRVIKTDMDGQVVWSKMLYGGGNNSDFITGMGTVRPGKATCSSG